MPLEKEEVAMGAEPQAEIQTRVEKTKKWILYALLILAGAVLGQILSGLGVNRDLEKIDGFSSYVEQRLGDLSARLDQQKETIKQLEANMTLGRKKALNRLEKDFAASTKNTLKKLENNLISSMNKKQRDFDLKMVQVNTSVGRLYEKLDKLDYSFQLGQIDERLQTLEARLPRIQNLP